MFHDVGHSELGGGGGGDLKPICMHEEKNPGIHWVLSNGFYVLVYKAVSFSERRNPLCK
jgi:hypothetical protein